MKPIEPCVRCRDYDGGRCLVGICAAVRCRMIAESWPLPPTPVLVAGPTPAQPEPGAVRG